MQMSPCPHPRAVAWPTTKSLPGGCPACCSVPLVPQRHLSRTLSGPERTRSSSTLCPLKCWVLAGAHKQGWTHHKTTLLTAQGSPNQPFIALFQHKSHENQHYKAGWVPTLLQQPMRWASGQRWSVGSPVPIMVRPLCKAPFPARMWHGVGVTLGSHHQQLGAHRNLP